MHEVEAELDQIRAKLLQARQTYGASPALNAALDALFDLTLVVGSLGTRLEFLAKREAG
jgi:hypothetical protein